VALTSAASGQLINNNWATLERDVTLRYFSSENFHPSSDPKKIWDKMGENITCIVDKHYKASVVPPYSFDASKPIKLFMHGFTRNGREFTTNLLPAWMERYEGSSSVILLDWESLARNDLSSGMTDYWYIEAAYNSIDVGEFAGLCLAELSNSYGLRADLIHLVGHSLGGHSVGKMGRTFQSAHLRGEKVRRITGLDPAGPRFESNGYEDALQDLKINILTAESATFVDVIHSNGGFTPSILHAALHLEKPRLGYLEQLGHMDFYPDGGSHQVGCPPTWISLLGGEPTCSHNRALIFYFYSINEKKLFPSQPCKSVRDCNKKLVQADQVLAYMGEDAELYYQGGKHLFYTDVRDCNWNYKVHNNESCSMMRELTDAEQDLIQEVWVEGRVQEADGRMQLQHQTVNKKVQQPIINQILSSTAPILKCDSMNTAFMAVARARMSLDCGGGDQADQSTYLGNSDVIEAMQPCLRTDDKQLCLMRSLNNLGNTKCSSLRAVERGLKYSLAIFCQESEVDGGLAPGGSCGYWRRLGCTAAVLAAEATVCSSAVVINTVACLEATVRRDCTSCVCQIVGC